MSATPESYQSGARITPTSTTAATWQTPDGWQQGRGAWGGLVIAALLNAATDAVAATNLVNPASSTAWLEFSRETGSTSRHLPTRTASRSIHSGGTDETTGFIFGELATVGFAIIREGKGE